MRLKTKAYAGAGVLVLACAAKGGAFAAADHAAAHAAHLAHLAHAARGGAGTQDAQAVTVAAGPAPSGPVDSSVLTRDQNIFANELAKKTGLSPWVVAAEVLAEESGGAADQRQASGDENWGNIGWTGNGNIGTTSKVWFSGPVVAADYTAAWMAGTWCDPPFGCAAAGIRHILTSAGHSIPVQIAAYQASPWAGSHYSTLPTCLAEVEHGQR